ATQQRLGIDVALAAVGPARAQRQREVQVRSRGHDARPPHAADQLARRDVVALLEVAADGVEVDVARDHRAALVPDADVAARAAPALLVALDALHDALERGEARLAQRGPEIHATVSQLALRGTRLRAGGAEASAFAERHRAPRPRQRVKPGDRRGG